MTHSARSSEPAATPISLGGYRYDPDDPQDAADFADHTGEQLTALATDFGLDFGDHPAYIDYQADLADQADEHRRQAEAETPYDTLDDELGPPASEEDPSAK